MSIRRNQIWLSLNRDPIRRAACDEYFKYYGGEMLRWYLDEEDESDQVLYTVLSRVGNPVVVVVNVPVSGLEISDADKLAEIFIYRYIRQNINDEFSEVFEAAPFLARDILPSEIEHVYNADVFRELIK